MLVGTPSPDPVINFYAPKHVIFAYIFFLLCAHAHRHVQKEPLPFLPSHDLVLVSIA